MLQLTDVRKRFRGKEVLRGINLQLDDGVYGLLGPNGSGKTTLMRCILNIYKLNGGTVMFDGMNTAKSEEFLKQVGYLPQKFGLFRELSVREMMCYLASLKKLPKETISAEVERCVELVNLSDRMDKKVRTLSGGMIRRLGIAQALLGDPKVIIVDEPTAGLDPEERMRFKNIISEIRKGKVIIISTHIVDDVEALCDHIVVLSAGQIIFSGPSEELKEKGKGKVFEIPESRLSESPGAYISKRYERDGKVYLNVLGADIKGTPIDADLENAYLCVLKKI